MPLREPRMEEDRQQINALLGWSGISIASIYQFVKEIPEASNVRINTFVIYNRGNVRLEDTERRPRKCVMISIWSDKIEEPSAECLFQLPIPTRIRLSV